MSRRYLSVQNKTTSHDQPTQSSSILTRSSTKRTNQEESIPNKKSKIDDEENEKENIPKRQTTKRPESLPIPKPIPKPSANNHEDDTDLSDSDSDEEDNTNNTVLSINIDNTGTEHPTNKQYIIYDDVDLNQERIMISKTARFWSRKYRQALRRVFPDSYDMYIHADFSCYGELEVVENCLRDLFKDIFVTREYVSIQANYKLKPKNKINYVLGFRRLEALTILLDHADGISGIDDGDRFGEIMRVIGACYVTILRGLLPKEMFKTIENFDDTLVKKLNKISKQLPNFKQILEHAIIIGYLFVTIGDVCSAYTNILQIIYCNWVLVMDKKSIDWNKKSTYDQLWNALKHASQIDQNDIEYDGIESFDFLTELRLYKANHGLGGDSHDLSKWTKSERDAYSYRRFNPFQGFACF